MATSEILKNLLNVSSARVRPNVDGKCNKYMCGQLPHCTLCKWFPTQHSNRYTWTILINRNVCTCVQHVAIFSLMGMMKYTDDVKTSIWV